MSLRRVVQLSLLVLLMGNGRWPTDTLDLSFVYEASSAEEAAERLRAFKEKRGLSVEHRPASLELSDQHVLHSIDYAIELLDGRRVIPSDDLDRSLLESREPDRDHTHFWLTTKDPLTLKDYLRLLDAGVRILAHGPAQTYVLLVPRSAPVRNRRSQSLLPKASLWLGLYGDDYRQAATELPAEEQEYEITAFCRALPEHRAELIEAGCEDVALGDQNTIVARLRRDQVPQLLQGLPWIKFIRPARPVEAVAMVVGELTLEESTTYYDVRGLTVRDLHRSINTNKVHAGLGHGSAVGQTSLTNVQYRWDWSVDPSGSGFVIDSLNLTGDLVITLPQWRDEEIADDGLVKKWKRFRLALEEHEYEHRSIWLQSIGELRERVAQIGLRPTRESLSAALDSVSSTVFVEFDHKQRMFDRSTRHGMDSGVELKD